MVHRINKNLDPRDQIDGSRTSSGCDVQVIECTLDEGAVAPAYASSNSAGADLRAHISEPITIRPGQRRSIPTGIRLSIPQEYEGQVRPRSGLAFRHGITVINAPGTIDPDFRGEIKVLLINHGQDEFSILPGDRIAQLVISPIVRPKYKQMTELSDSDRGVGGFGSTGVK